MPYNFVADGFHTKKLCSRLSVEKCNFTRKTTVLRVWAHLGGGSSGNVRCSSWAHWKVRSGLPISINWSFFARCYGWVATSEEIENRRFRSNAVTLIQNFRWKGSPPPIIFAWLVRPMNALQLCRWQFSHKETLYQIFFNRSAIFLRKSAVLRFWDPLLGT